MTATQKQDADKSSARKGIFATANIIAGISVGAYLIPQAMAYGSLAGVAPAVSLTISVAPLIAYMLFGRNPYMSLGPESAVALMAAAAVGPVASEHGIPPATALAVTTILVGVILGIGWLAKASFLADLLSHPILVGYMTGVAVLMIMSQLSKVVDYDVNSDTIFDLFKTQWQVPDWETVGIAAIVVIISFAMRKISKRIPGPLIGLIAATIIGLPMQIPKVGEVKLQIPEMGFAGLTLETVQLLFVPALSIAIVSFTDVMITSRAFSGKEQPNSGVEMRALAAAQLAAGAVGGYPMSASSSRTALAYASRATTRFYSIFVIMVLIGGPLLIPGAIALVPKAALAGVIIYAALTLVMPSEWKALAQFRWTEAGIAAVCTVSVIVFGILPGVIIAIVLSIAELLARLSRPHDGVLGFVPNTAGMHDVDDHEFVITVPGMVAFRYDAPLFFMNAYDFYYKVTSAVEEDTKVVILNMEANVELDATALNVFQELHDNLAAEGVQLWLARVKNDVRIPMQDHGVAQAIGAENMYPTLADAVEAYREKFPEQASEASEALKKNRAMDVVEALEEPDPGPKPGRYLD